MLPEPIVSPPETSWLFWLDDCDWLMLCSAELLPPLFSPCANALLPLLNCPCSLKLLHDRNVVPPDKHWPFWLDDCNWSIDCVALLVILDLKILVHENIIYND